MCRSVANPNASKSTFLIHKMLTAVSVPQYCAAIWLCSRNLEKFEPACTSQDYLTAFTETAILVSHDRHFLDTVATDVIQLNTQKLSYYRGGYTTFSETAAEQRPTMCWTEVCAYRRQVCMRVLCAGSTFVVPTVAVAAHRHLIAIEGNLAEDPVVIKMFFLFI